MLNIWWKYIRKSDLLAAIRSGHLEIVKYLVEQGADIHMLYGEPLRFASELGHLEIVKYLVEQGVNIHIRNDIALRKASQEHHTEIVRYLIEQGANIHANNDEVFKNILKWVSVPWNEPLKNELLKLELLDYLKRVVRNRLKKELTKSYIAISKTSPVNLGRHVIKNISYRSIYEELCSIIKGDIPPLKLLALADILKIKYDYNTSYRDLCGAVKLMLLF